MKKKWPVIPAETNTVTYVEAWLATIVFGFILLYLVADEPSALPVILKYLVVFACYLLAIFYALAPSAPFRQKLWRCTTVLVLLAVLLTIANLNAVDPDFGSVLRQTLYEVAIVGVVFAGHAALKETGVVLLRKLTDREGRFFWVFNETNTVVLILFAIGLYYSVLLQLNGEIILTFGTLIFTAIFCYGASFNYFLPQAFRSKSRGVNFGWRLFVFSFFSLLLSLFVLMILTGEAELPMAIAIVNAMTQSFVVGPICFLLYKRNLTNEQKLGSLQTALDTSKASFDFLRAQINPHFLFNAFNTVYSTALQEGAHRTAEIIEKLSDMMRFMLHENVRERISLTDEVDYLKNFIDFQKLRMDVSSLVDLTVELPDEIPAHAVIPPMTLIPFVENAFKHGVSNVDSSLVRVTLTIAGLGLQYEVFNTKRKSVSVKLKNEKGGVGLSNVSERLQLLYPHQHSLTIRETEESFYVRLLLPLTPHDSNSN